jgi:chemotaxis protein methyltransferase CheR
VSTLAPAVPESDARDYRFTPAHFKFVQKRIHQLAGIALLESKQDMVYSRLMRRLRALRLDDFDVYLDIVKDDQHPEVEAFVNALTTNLTAFFREAHHFERLITHLRRANAPRPIRIWCAAASTGEEPWSLAITACEAFDTLRPPVEIIATDIDTDALTAAASGRYALSRLAPLKVEQKRRFFLKGKGAHEGFARVRPELTALVRFQTWNLLARQSPPWRDIDVVFCRNVMIYFDKPTQLHVLEQLRSVMRPDGLMFAGHSESFFHAQHVFRSLGQTVYAPVMSGAA